MANYQEERMERAKQTGHLIGMLEAVLLFAKGNNYELPEEVCNHTTKKLDEYKLKIKESL